MIDKQLLIDKLKQDEKYKDLLIDVLTGEFDSEDYEILTKSLIGETIQNFFCNGFFGSRTFDLTGAEIVRIYKSDDNSIVIEVKKYNGNYEYGYFEEGRNDWKTVYEYLCKWMQEEEE